MWYWLLTTESITANQQTALTSISLLLSSCNAANSLSFSFCNSATLTSFCSFTVFKFSFQMKKQNTKQSTMSNHCKLKHSESFDIYMFIDSFLSQADKTHSLISSHRGWLHSSVGGALHQWMRKSWVQIALKPDSFSGLILQLLKLLHNCDYHIFYSFWIVLAFNQVQE